MSQGGWAPITRRVAVTVDGDSLDVADLVLIGALTGEWSAFEKDVALGLELEREHPDRLTPDDVRREATAFRYAHGLISAADFRAWLEARQMTVVELSAVLGRRLLRRAEWSQTSSHGPPASDEEVMQVLAPEAFCDGVLGRLADRAVDWLVAGQLAPADSAVDDGRLRKALGAVAEIRPPVLGALASGEVRARLGRLLSLERALEQLRHEVAAPGAVARRMKQHALEWTELVGDELRFARQGAAREARLQITADGASIGAVAERAAVSVLDRRLLVDEAPPAVGVSFAAAAVGEVIGPWEEDGRWHVMQLRAKVPPSPESRELRERASGELLSERIKRHAAGRTTRDGQL